MKTNLELNQQIEQLIQNHIAEIRSAAEQAVARAFTNAFNSSKRSSPKKNCGSADVPKRSKQEILDIGEKLCAAVGENPGETMAVLSGKIGLSPKELHLPMVKLKKSNRVKSIGHRNFTRYYPLTQEDKKCAA